MTILTWQTGEFSKEMLILTDNKNLFVHNSFKTLQNTVLRSTLFPVRYRLALHVREMRDAYSAIYININKRRLFHVYVMHNVHLNVKAIGP